MAHTPLLAEVLRAAPPPKMITLDWPLGIPDFQAGGVPAELDLRSAFIPYIYVLVLHATPVHAAL